MTGSDDTEDLRLTPYDNEVVSEWVQTLRDSGFVTLSDDGEMWMQIPSELDREVDTEPLDRLTVISGSDFPRMISITKINGKWKLLLSLDSNILPHQIDSLRALSDRIYSKVRMGSMLLLLISGMTYALESVYGIGFPDVLDTPRFVVFCLTGVFLPLSDRIALQGVAKGKPTSFWGCTECGDVSMKQAKFREVTDDACSNCGGEAIGLVQGEPGSVVTRSSQFEKILNEELKRAEGFGPYSEDGSLIGIHRVKRDLDGFYDDDNIIAIYGLALEVTDEIEWSEVDQDVVGPGDGISVHKSFGARGEEGSPQCKIANALLDAMLARAVIFRADEKDGVSIEEQFEELRELVDKLKS